MEVKREQIVYVDGKSHIKCGMVMLHANQESELCLSFKENSFGNLTDEKLVKIDSACYNLSNIKSQHLYITSNQEIKKDDWYIFDVGYASGVKQADLDDIENIHLEIDPKKIIATTDTSLGLPQPSQSFIEKYIEEYNKGNQIIDVMVEAEEIINPAWESYFEFTDYCMKHGYDKQWYSKEKLKIDSQNIVTIRKQKDSWTREELPIDDLKLIVYTINNDPFKSKYIGKITMKSLNNLNKWIKENL